MKKAYLILGLLFFLSNIFVFDLIHLFQKLDLHREAQEAMTREGASNARVIVVSSLEDLTWEIPGQEFQREGKMFDVYGIVKIEHGYKLYVRSDGKETESNQRWAEFKKSKEASSNEGSNTLPDFQSFPFIKSHFELHFYSQSEAIVQGTTRVKSLVSAVLPSIPIPPPEFC